MLFKGDKVVIPSEMRKEIKEKLHHGHLDIEKLPGKSYFDQESTPKFQKWYTTVKRALRTNDIDRKSLSCRITSPRTHGSRSA